MKFQKLTFISLFCLLFLACEQPKKSWNKVENPVIGRVNEAEITKEQYENAYIEYVMRIGANDSENNRLGVWESLVDAVLLSKWAFEKDLVTDQMVVNAEIYAARRASREWISDQVEQATKPLTDEDKRRAFVRSKTKLVVRHLFTRNQEEIEYLAKELENGVNFINLANKLYSTAEFDSSAGMIGEIDYLNSDDAFAEAAYALKVNEFSKPVRSAHGWHIIRLEEIRRPGIFTEDEFELREPSISNLEFARERKKIANEIIHKIMNKTNPSISNDGLKKLEEIVVSLPSFQLEMEQNSLSRSVYDYESFSSNPEIAQIEIAKWNPSGKIEAFTIGDYLKWLPYQSRVEAKTRIGASIGRALRNEKLARIAKEEGYLNHPLVEAEKQRAVWMQTMKVALANLETQTFPVEKTEEYKKAFEMSRFNRPVDFNLVLWERDVDSSVGIEQILNEKPSFKKWKKSVVKVSDLPNIYRNVAKTADLNKVYIVSEAGKYKAICIVKREPIQPVFEDFILKEGAELWKYQHQIETIRKLRAQSSIKLDSLEFWKTVSYKSRSKN